MKKSTYRISLIIALIILLLVYFGTYRYAVSEIRENTDENSLTKTEYEAEEDPEEEESLSVDKDDSKITSDTTYVLERYNANTYTLTEEELAMPVEFIGMGREDLINYISEYETSPSLSDVEDGFLYIELVSFSKNSITIRKTYKPDDVTAKYCLIVENGYITVYYIDMKTVYTYTDIPLSSLPDEVQQEVIDGKQITNLQDLYNFLETFSS